ncbi:hypothetical protein DAEQUDRAFT_200453 [Daedalea quercina L-15889]|uniref:Uncharacterized protein n=1 Tax=Daedalea quercina L-15889 TaxID=1314783 RepID=A0A165U9H6_9APHY|nr:hypothetical protein DAEQUDRAFT_200453 [Daedalea quercina L-15889]
MLAHKCLHGDSRSDGDDPYRRFIYGKLVHTTAGLGAFYISEQLSACKPTKKTSQLIRFCGKDPRTATATEMDALDIRLVRDNEEMMTWRAAILHEETQVSNSKWRLAAPDEVVKAKERESEVAKQASAWSCIPCNTHAVFTFNNALGHLERKHGIKNPSLDHEHLKSYLPSDSLASSGVFQLKLDDAKRAR